MRCQVAVALTPFLCLAAIQSIAEEVRPRQLLRVASISLKPDKLKLDENAARLEAKFREAAEGGAKLAVAPEGVLDGYLVNEIIAGDIVADRMRDVAVPIDSPVIQRFQDLARELSMGLVFGFAEQIGENVFNTAVLIDDQGTIRGKYHKMQFAEGYHDSWWFNRLGSRSRAFDTPWGRCGIMICNDRWNAQLAEILASDGAQFLVIPAYGSTSKRQDEAVLARGVETGLPIIEANVGVSLVVSNNAIATVERQTDGVTFSEIMIPTARKIDARSRDETERAFLDWRDGEMVRRLKARMQQVGRPLPTLAMGTRVSPEVSRVEGETRWYRLQDIGVEGKAWTDTESFFDRLPGAREGNRSQAGVGVESTFGGHLRKIRF